MQLSCPTCATDIASHDVNLDNLVAKCAACNEVFSFSDRLDAPARKHRRKAETPPGRAPGIRVEEGVDGVTITRRWFTAAALFLVVFCVMWDGFLVLWYATALGKDAPLIMKLFPIGHVAVGLGLTWFTIACLVNRSVIRVNYDRLTVRHGPVPWPGRRTLPATEILQLYCEERLDRTRNGTPNRRYILNAITQKSRRIKLLTLDDLDQARSIEQAIERFLDIQDRPIEGEA